MRRSKNSVIGMVTLLMSLVLMTGFLATSVMAVPASLPGSNNTSFALQTAGESDLNVRITSSDPDVANRLASGSTVRLQQGTRVEFSGTVPDSLLQLPRTLGLGAAGETVPYGTYTLTINAGENFEVFSSPVTVDQADQTVNVELEVTSTAVLVNALVEKLKEILRDALATQTPTATATSTATATATGTATPVTPTATATPVTPTAMATATPVTPTATIVPAGEVLTSNVAAGDTTLTVDDSTTFSVTATGRTGPVGTNVGVTYTSSNPAVLALTEGGCTGCSEQDNDSARFTYSANTPYTASLTFQAEALSAGTAIVSVTVTDMQSGDNITRNIEVTVAAPPTPTPVTPTATATETTVAPPATFTYAGSSCNTANDAGEQTCTADLASGDTEPITCTTESTGVECTGTFGDSAVDTYNCVYDSTAGTGICTLDMTSGT